MELKNNILEGKRSHLPAKEAYKIYLHTHKRMKEYARKLKKRTFASYEVARTLILNS